MKTNKKAQKYTDIGKDGEEFISNLSKITFLKDWTFINPVNPKTNKEICDILIAFDDSITIIQVKNTKPKYKNDFVAFRTQDINKNLKQLDGAYRYFQDNNNKSLECVNLHGQTCCLQIKDFTSYRLISAFTSKEEYDGMDMFRISPKGSFVHCFDRAFSLILFQELDTHCDLINYLDKRESFLTQAMNKLIINGGEEELLANYMFNDKTFLCDENKQKNINLLVEAGNWEIFTKRPEYIAKKEADSISYLWDKLIEEAHRSLEPSYEIIVREMAKLNRFERRCMAKAFMDAFNSFNYIEEDIFRRYCPLSKYKVTFVLCLFKSGVLGNSQESRSKLLQATCINARVKIPENKTVIGISCSTEKQTGYEFILYESERITEQAEELHNTLNKDDSQWVRRKNITQSYEEEYPS